MDLTKLTAANLLERCPERIVTGNWNPEWAEIRRRLKRLEQCEAALLKARMLLVNEGDPDEDSEMIAEIDELLGNAARAALEGK